MLVAFLFTVITEILVAILFGFRNKNSILTVFFINLITNPILNYFLWINNYYISHFSFIDTYNFPDILILEIIIIFIEWLLLEYILRQNSDKLFILSFIMNFCSFIIGSIILVLF